MFVYALTSCLTQLLVITNVKSTKVSDITVITSASETLFLFTLASFYICICFNGIYSIPYIKPCFYLPWLSSPSSSIFLHWRFGPQMTPLCLHMYGITILLIDGECPNMAPSCLACLFGPVLQFFYGRKIAMTLGRTTLSIKSHTQHNNNNATLSIFWMLLYWVSWKEMLRRINQIYCWRSL